jgi:hypothetical protein
MTPITRAAILALSTVGLFAIQAFPYDRVRAQEIPKQEDGWREDDWERCDEHARDMRMERGRNEVQEGSNEVTPNREKTGLNIRQFVLYAERSLSLGDFSRVCRGDLGVRSFGDAPAGSQLKIGSDVFIQPNHSLFSPSVLVGRNVTLGVVETNQFIDDGIRLGSATSFPVTAMPTLPLAAAAAGGGPNIFVGADQELTLQPGNYDAVRVNGFLMLNPGLYTVSKLVVGDFGRIIAIAGSVRMTVVQTLIAGRHAEIHPAIGLPAEHLRISVAGSDVRASRPRQSASIVACGRCWPHRTERSPLPIMCAPLVRSRPST